MAPFPPPSAQAGELVDENPTSVPAQAVLNAHNGRVDAGAMDAKTERWRRRAVGGAKENAVTVHRQHMAELRAHFEEVWCVGWVGGQSYHPGAPVCGSSNMGMERSAEVRQATGG